MGPLCHKEAKIKMQVDVYKITYCVAEKVAEVAPALAIAC